MESDHCDCDEDTAEHMVAHCPVWLGQHRIFVSQIGADLSLPTVVASMIGSDESWKAMLYFYESTISQKVAAEPERESAFLFAPT